MARDSIFDGLFDSLKSLSRRVRKLEDEPKHNAYYVDANVYGILPLELYMQTGNNKFFQQGIELADIQWENPLPNGLTNQTRFWIDECVFIICRVVC